MTQPIPPLELAKEILNKAVASDCRTRGDLALAARHVLKHTPYAFPTSLQFWTAYRELLDQGMPRHEGLERALRIKDVRTDSGVAPVTVLTKPFPCPGNCVYCPTEARMPKSYISSEPAAARALSLQFDPYEQVRQRILTLERNGHQANKIELIVKGGTWSFYPEDYQEWFITRCFEAANTVPHPSSPSHHQMGEGAKDPLVKGGWGDLLDAQTSNETAAHRIIGLTIETRPDWVTPQEVIHLRKLGVTRVELGLQIINDRVLEGVKRGTTVADAERAIALLKTAGFKVDVHMMPGLPGATPEDDLESFRLLFADPRFRPDMVKIYPCVVMPGSELAAWTERGEFRPIEGAYLQELLIKMQTMVPRYCRVPRMIRDFPTKDIAYGNKESNLREAIDNEMKRRGLQCVCLRCREVGHVPGDHTGDKTEVFEERNENAGGTEVFLSVENEDRSAVFGFCRLRLPKISLNPSLTRGTSGLPSLSKEGLGVDFRTEISLNPSLTRGTSTQHGTVIPYDSKLASAACDLRNNQTACEKIVWDEILSRDGIGFRFLRQKPLDHFIVDFYCSELLLAIEIDDPSHADRLEYDKERSERLAVYGIKVVRYTNQEVLLDLERIKCDLLVTIADRQNELASPLSKGDGGIFDAFPVLREAAIIRELHTYGTALNIDQHKDEAAQHKGYGRRLMARAEEIALSEGYGRMAVISGIGVREYYRQLGYAEQDTYMVKALA